MTLPFYLFSSVQSVPTPELLPTLLFYHTPTHPTQRYSRRSGRLGTHFYNQLSFGQSRQGYTSCAVLDIVRVCVCHAVVTGPGTRRPIPTGSKRGTSAPRGLQRKKCGNVGFRYGRHRRVTYFDSLLT